MAEVARGVPLLASMPSRLHLDTHPQPEVGLRDKAVGRSKLATTSATLITQLLATAVSNNVRWSLMA